VQKRRAVTEEGAAAAQGPMPARPPAHTTKWLEQLYRPLWAMIASCFNIVDLHRFRRVARAGRSIAREQVVSGRFLAKSVLDKALKGLPDDVRVPVRELLDNGLVVLSGSSALHALSGASWHPSDLDLFAVLDKPTVEQVMAALDKVAGNKLISGTALSSSLGRLGASLRPGRGPREAVPLAQEPELRDEIAKRITAWNIKCTVCPRSYTKVGSIALPF
jgi:hypothetical protein